VLAALAGRRPLGAVPRRLVPIGLTSFAAGIGLLVLVTVATTNGDGQSDDSIYAVAAVIGGLLVLGGMCCASPVAVDLIGRSAPASAEVGVSPLAASHDRAPAAPECSLRSP
jgi:hypothetical protein